MGRLGIIVTAVLLVCTGVKAVEISQAEWDRMKKDIDDLRRNKAGQSSQINSNVDKIMDSKYGPNTPVKTNTGKLTISGLVQVWYYSIQNDHHGLFEDANVNGVADTGEAIDNDSFRIRRTELKFTMDIHENVTAVVMMDPAREATSFPSMNANTGTSKRTANVNVANVQTGAGAVPRLLQDAFINYHGVVPHHDFTIGQFKPFFGEEGIRSSGQLDFAERSFIGQLGDQRDLGLAIHGAWWNDRFQYWLDVMDGAGNYFGSAGQFQNRSDDNDDKDYGYRVLVRPLWKQETWGSLELGMSSEWGKHGESSGRNPIDTPLNGLNRERTSAIRHAAWASYMPGGPVRGWWLRGEWSYMKDRHNPESVIDLAGNDESGNNLQDIGAPFHVQGWYVATGYKLSESRFADCSTSWLKPFEFTFRYDTFQNVQVADLNNPRHTDVFATSVYTAGINYYIKGHNAKIQANYDFVNNPDQSNGSRSFHDPHNDNFVVNFQVAF